VLKANSPVFQADRVVAPVLLMHGTLDATVPVEHALELQKALRKARKPAQLVQFSRTGHSVLLEQHEQEYYARLLEFLADNIGKPGS
jgi:dipeptidyl aminopeptidase/acylaminoacyl peptidase